MARRNKGERGRWDDREGQKKRWEEKWWERRMGEGDEGEMKVAAIDRKKKKTQAKIASQQRNIKGEKITKHEIQHTLWRTQVDGTTTQFHHVAALNHNNLRTNGSVLPLLRRAYCLSSMITLGEQLQLQLLLVKRQNHQKNRPLLCRHFTITSRLKHSSHDLLMVSIALEGIMNFLRLCLQGTGKWLPIQL